jgi:hypothetical protein
MKSFNTIVMAVAVTLTTGCHSKRNDQPTTKQLQEPVVEVHVTDEVHVPISTACAVPADVYWSGAPYCADENGMIRLTAISGKDILVFAPGYLDGRIAAAEWLSNRFPNVILSPRSERNGFPNHGLESTSAPPAAGTLETHP